MPTVLLSQFLTTERQAGRLEPDLGLLLMQVTEACKQIGVAIGKGALGGMLGAAGTDNVQGEEQKKLDVLSNEILLQATAWGGQLAASASEEMEDPQPVPAGYPVGRYLLLFDPLDGSSNIDVNVSVGTIFSILPYTGSGQADTGAFLQPGTQQLAAGYVLYGPRTLLMLTLGHGVYEFTLDRETGSFVQTRSQIQIPEDASEFAINVSNQRRWEAPMQHYVDELLQGKEGPRQRDFNMRWVASMVADVHRILTRGGVFYYPLDRKIQQQGGKLRLLYEANPMSFLVEQAGGAASTGRERLMELKPSKLHQRVPVFLGAKNEIEHAVRHHRQADRGA